MRVTALIRRALELEMLAELVAHQSQAIRQELRQHHVIILEQTKGEHDVRIQYRYNDRLYEATYMRPMLDSVVRGVLRPWLKDQP
jgi:DNA-binding GntR family transcriptional regulator